MQIRKVKTNFTGGEIGKLLEGRSNLETYQDGMSELRDFRIMPQGGMRRRPALKHCATIATVAYQHEDYVFNSEQIYQLLFSNGCVDVHDGIDGSPIQTITGAPWTLAMIGELSVHGGGDYIFVCHPDLRIQQLRRTSATTFVLSDYAFEKAASGVVAPVYQPYYKYADAGDLLKVQFIEYSGGASYDSAVGWIAGASAVLHTFSPFFTPAYVGTMLKVGNAQFEITAYTDSQNVTAVLRTDDLRLDAPEFPFRTVDGSPYIDVNIPFHGLDDGQVVVFTGAEAFRNIPSSGVNGAVTTTWLSPNTFRFTCGTVVDKAAFGGGVDVKWWSDRFTTLDWAEPAYSVVRGWPNCVGSHQDRLIFGGGKSLPNRLVFSKIEAPFNFDVGTGLDDESIQISISFKKVPIIRHVISDKHLLIFTSEGEFYAPFGLGNKPLTPATVSVIPQTNYGVKARHMPQQFDGAVLLLTKTGSSLREVVFGNNDVGYSAPNLAFQAQHLLRSPGAFSALPEAGEDQDVGIQQEATAYVPNGDGTVATFAFVRKESIAAWALWATAGTIKTVRVVDREVFFIVERTIDGATVTTLEKLDAGHLLDCSLKFTGASATTWGGFAHLAGQ